MSTKIFCTFFCDQSIMNQCNNFFSQSIVLQGPVQSHHVNKYLASLLIYSTLTVLKTPLLCIVYKSQYYYELWLITTALSLVIAHHPLSPMRHSPSLSAIRWKFAELLTQRCWYKVPSEFGLGLGSMLFPTRIL